MKGVVPAVCLTSQALKMASYSTIAHSNTLQLAKIQQSQHLPVSEVVGCFQLAPNNKRCGANCLLDDPAADLDVGNHLEDAAAFRISGMYEPAA
jgi:hypothetical protein